MDVVTFPVRLLFGLARAPLFRAPAGRAISWLGAKALAAPAAALRQTLPVLPEASKDLEGGYLALGSAFEELAGLASELVSASRHVVAMASGRETGETDFERTLGVLAAPAEFLSLALTELPEVATSLSRASRQAGRLVALEQALEETLAPLRFTQLMFSVESASLSDQARESFGALTCQIGALHQRVQVSIRQHFDALVETRRSLSRAASELEQFSSSRLHELRERRECIEQTLARLAGEVRDSARREGQVTLTSDAMAAEVNRSVTAMQTQDIVAQKLEHASRGLADVAQTVHEIRCRDGVQCLRRVATVARIELAHLDATNHELVRSQAALSQAVHGIEARLKEMDNECLMLHQFQNVTASVDGTAQVLIDSIEGLREMTCDTLRITHRLEEILRPVQSAAGIVTGSVSDVAADIHRIALNAQVHAVQTGGRTGLEVLAEHIAGLAGETLRINAELCAGLTESVGEMAASTQRLARLRQSGEEALRACNEDAAREEASLHGFRDRVLAEMHRVGELLDRARAKTSGMLSNLDLNSVLEHIASARKKVEELAEAADALTPPLDPAYRHREVATLAHRYTMESERHTHRKVMQAMQPGAPVPEHCPEPELSSNIELF